MTRYQIKEGKLVLVSLEKRREILKEVYRELLKRVNYVRKMTNIEDTTFEIYIDDVVSYKGHKIFPKISYQFYRGKNLASVFFRGYTFDTHMIDKDIEIPENVQSHAKKIISFIIKEYRKFVKDGVRRRDMESIDWEK